jgi:hypothetical protein
VVDPNPATSVRSQRVQTSGDPDGACDTDSAITTGAITADKGWIVKNVDNAPMAIVHIDLDEAASGNWEICVRALNPYTETYTTNYDCTETFSGDEAGILLLGPTNVGWRGFEPTTALDLETTRALTNSLPSGQFQLFYDEGTATSITLDLGIELVY